jgi:hypothetical protein
LSQQTPNAESISTEVPQGIRTARAAFLRDFTSLLADRKTRGRYVCYHKDKLVAVTKDYLAMIEEVNAKAYPEDESLIIKVRPGAGQDQQDLADEVEIDPI